MHWAGFETMIYLWSILNPFTLKSKILKIFVPGSTFSKSNSWRMLYIKKSVKVKRRRPYPVPTRYYVSKTTTYIDKQKSCPALYPRGKDPRYPLDKKLVGLSAGLDTGWKKYPLPFIYSYFVTFNKNLSAKVNQCFSTQAIYERIKYLNFLSHIMKFICV
jgi:hypothetical protein